MAVTQVTGVKDTIRELRQLEPRLAREAVKSIKAPALPTAAALRAIAPAVPLSHMGYYGPTKVTDGIGGTGVFKLIHTAALREGRTSAGFEEWIASVDDIDANESDPTSPQPEASGT